MIVNCSITYDAWQAYIYKFLYLGLKSSDLYTVTDAVKLQLCADLGELATAIIEPLNGPAVGLQSKTMTLVNIVRGLAQLDLAAKLMCDGHHCIASSSFNDKFPSAGAWLPYFAGECLKTGYGSSPDNRIQLVLVDIGAAYARTSLKDIVEEDTVEEPAREYWPAVTARAAHGS